MGFVTRIVRIIGGAAVVALSLGAVAAPAAALPTAVTAVAPPRVTITPLTTGFAVSWSPGSVPGAVGYKVVRTDSAGASTTVATLPLTARMFRDETADVGKSYRYQVVAYPWLTDARGKASVAETTANDTNTRVADEIVATAKCPASTVRVATSAQLSSALLAAKAGTVILLAPGTYTGQFKLRNVDGGASRIWICGPSTAVLTTGSTSTGSALMLTGASNVVVHGLTFTKSQKGVTVITGNRVTLRDLTITESGYEAVHFRTQTVDSAIIGSRITGAGRVEPKYGEGVYVGTSSGNICTQNNCLPDRTERVAVVDNIISETGAQPVEVKEGAVSAFVSGNRITGASWMDVASKGLVLLKGNDSYALNNNVKAVRGYGLAVIFSAGGVGNDNVFGGNVVSGAPTYGIWANVSASTSGPTVFCSNSTPAGVPIANLTCVP